MLLRSLRSLACTTFLAPVLLATASLAQAPASPPAIAMISLNGKAITIKYNSPAIRGRKIMGGLVPYGQVWRTGANPATTLITATDLRIGTLIVPAGTYTVYTLPSADTWQLIINKQTGQWGTVYDEKMDLGRTPMTGITLPAPQENMSISFEQTKGGTTQLHVKWENTDEYVTVSLAAADRPVEK
jgi:Protein of unknown function (DUF2911)